MLKGASVEEGVEWERGQLKHSKCIT